MESMIPFLVKGNIGVYLYMHGTRGDALKCYQCL